jgi:hypothetical protein
VFVLRQRLLALDQEIAQRWAAPPADLQSAD